MTTEPDAHDLGQAIQAFQSAEAALARLSEQAQTLAGAGEQLDLARTALDDVRGTYTESLQQHAELTRRLTELSSDLVEATDIVRRNDPAKVFDAIDRLSADFERQKERVSEMTGELRARLDESTRTLEAALHEQRKSLDQAAEVRSQQTSRKLMRPAVAAALFAAAAVALQIADLVTR